MMYAQRSQQNIQDNIHDATSAELIPPSRWKARERKSLQVRQQKLARAIEKITSTSSQTPRY